MRKETITQSNMFCSFKVFSNKLSSKIINFKPYFKSVKQVTKKQLIHTNFP